MQQRHLSCCGKLLLQETRRKPIPANCNAVCSKSIHQSLQASSLQAILVSRNQGIGANAADPIIHAETPLQVRRLTAPCEGERRLLTSHIVQSKKNPRLRSSYNHILRESNNFRHGLNISPTSLDNNSYGWLACKVTQTNLSNTRGHRTHTSYVAHSCTPGSGWHSRPHATGNGLTHKSSSCGRHSFYIKPLVLKSSRCCVPCVDSSVFLHGINSRVLHAGILSNGSAGCGFHNSAVRNGYDSARGRGVNWDNFGIWNNRLEEPILLQQSIKHGIPIPKISLQRIGHESVTGRRAVNEDRICIKELLPNLLYVAIFDGHAGAHAVDYVHANLEHHLLFWHAREYDLQIVLRNAFVDLNNKLTQYLYLNFPEAQHEHTGSTATVALVRNGNELVLANLGDSRAILCRNSKAIRLTTDHDPDANEKERERIKASGGYISWNSLGKPLVNGVLTMTRSFGDVTLKRYGVIAEPESRSLEIKHGRDSFLALCTDGIHFVMSDQELCDSINLCPTPQDAACFICDQALQFGSEDNASIIIVPLGMWGRSSGPTHMHSLRWQGRSGA